MSACCRPETGKGKGFGYVRYAIPEDAARAIQELATKPFEGRQLQVQYAKRRPSQKERRGQRPPPEGQPHPTDAPAGDEHAPLGEQDAVADDDRPAPEAKDVAVAADVSPAAVAPVFRPTPARRAGPTQEDVRSVVISQLPAEASKASIAKKVRKFGAVESLTFPVEGRDGVAFVCFTQTKDAVRAVQRLHQQKMLGAVLEVCSKAREGKGVVRKKKARLIVRNLAFQSAEVRAYASVSMSSLLGGLRGAPWGSVGGL